MKRWIAFVLAAVLAFSLLAGCKKKGEEGGNDPANPQERPEFTYTSSYAQVKNGDEYIRNFAYASGRVYFVSYKWNYEEVVDEETGEIRSVDKSVFHICSMATDGTDLKTISEYKLTPPDEGWEGGSSISQLVAAPDGIWVLEQLYMSRFNPPEDVDPDEINEDEMWNYYESKEGYRLTKLSFAGEELLNLDVSKFADEDSGETDEDYGKSEGYFFISDIKTDSSGRVYIFAGNTILVLDSDGSFLFRAVTEQWVERPIGLKDGTIAFITRDWSGETAAVTLTKIDAANKKLSEPETCPLDSYDQIFPGSGDYDLYYTVGMNYMGIDFATGESTLLFNFINCDVDADYLQNLIPIEDGSLLAFAYEYGGDRETTGMYRIYKVRTEELPVKTYLTYACMGLDGNVRRQIVDFNRTNQKYRIEIVDYSQYIGTGEDSYTQALQKLTTELLAGNVPDMFATSNMPIRQLEAKGYLEDLWPYIEKDYGRSGVVEPFFNALSSSDGKLYQICPYFSVSTIAGMTSVVGDKMGWNMDDLMRAYRSLGPDATIFGIGYTREDALRTITSIMLDGYINWTTGEVSFDSANFVSLLEFANLFPADFDWEKYWEEHQGEDYYDENPFQQGTQLLATLEVSDFINWRSTEMMMGNDLTFVGYPVETGYGSAFTPSSGIAMSAACADKAGAWEFMTRFLSESYQSSSNNSGMIYRDGIIGGYGNGFPTNKAVFDRALTDAKTPEYRKDEKGNFVLDENGQKIEEPKSWGYIVYTEVEDDVDEAPETGETDTEEPGAEEPIPVEPVEPWNDGAIYHLTDEQAAKVLDLINSTTRIYEYDEAIYDIIVDRASAFFSGSQTAQEAAKAIQSRAFLYVNEQR